MIGGLLLAAGSGSRMQGEVEDKLLHPIGAAHAFSLSCDAFLSVEELDCVVITYRNHDQLSRLQESWSHSLTGFAHSKKKDVFWVQGGKERQDSVYAGLLAFPETMTHILIHDCARPFIRPHTISHCCQEIIRNRAITVARPVKDTCVFVSTIGRNLIIREVLIPLIGQITGQWKPHKEPQNLGFLKG